LVIVAFIGGCSSGPSADLQYIKQARSLGAEWALVNEEAQKGSLTATYARSMRNWLNSDLQSAVSSLTEPETSYGREMRALLAEPPEAAPQQLRKHVDRLKQIEDQLESA